MPESIFWPTTLFGVDGLSHGNLIAMTQPAAYWKPLTKDCSSSDKT
ncbi:MAG: hypothetical protein M1368_04690 [Thaumarchaeota archaeon]|nr:hypothetical protein [Nitrososphaerota archaeon]